MKKSLINSGPGSTVCPLLLNMIQLGQNSFSISFFFFFLIYRRKFAGLLLVLLGLN